jgi:hypothetical protein
MRMNRYSSGRRAETAGIRIGGSYRARLDDGPACTLRAAEGCRCRSLRRAEHWSSSGARYSLRQVPVVGAESISTAAGLRYRHRIAGRLPSLSDGRREKLHWWWAATGSIRWSGRSCIDAMRRDSRQHVPAAGGNVHGRGSGYNSLRHGSVHQGSFARSTDQDIDPRRFKEIEAA